MWGCGEVSTFAARSSQSQRWAQVSKIWNHQLTVLFCGSGNFWQWTGWGSGCLCWKLVQIHRFLFVCTPISISSCFEMIALFTVLSGCSFVIQQRLLICCVCVLIKTCWTEYPCLLSALMVWTVISSCLGAICQWWYVLTKLMRLMAGNWSMSMVRSWHLGELGQLRRQRLLRLTHHLSLLELWDRSFHVLYFLIRKKGHAYYFQNLVPWSVLFFLL